MIQTAAVWLQSPLIRKLVTQSLQIVQFVLQKITEKSTGNEKEKQKTLPR